MTTTTKTPRLLEAAREFNIGKDTLVAFLAEKGFEINGSQNAKLSEQMYSSLQVEFAQDKQAKRKSDEITLPKGADNQRKHDNLRAKKSEFEPAILKDRKDAAPAHSQVPEDNQKVPEDAPKTIHEDKKSPGRTETTVQEQPSVPENKTDTKVDSVVTSGRNKHDDKDKSISSPKKDENTGVNNTVEIEAKEEKIVRHEKQESERTSAISDAINKGESTVKQSFESTVKKISESTDENQNLLSDKKQESNEPEHLEIKAPKIEGPNILGKINLDELNLASRPKKGAGKKKDEKKDEKKFAPSRDKIQTKEEKPGQEPETIILPVAIEPQTQTENIEEFEDEFEEDEVDEQKEQKEDENVLRPDHIEMKAPRLEGPKIIGRIELPVSQPSNASNAPKLDPNKKKRKRKRIILDKKQEDGTKPGVTGTSGQPTENRDRPRERGENRDNRDFRNDRNRIGGTDRNFVGRTGGGDTDNRQRFGADTNNSPRTGQGNTGQGSTGQQKQGFTPRTDRPPLNRDGGANRERTFNGGAGRDNNRENFDRKGYRPPFVAPQQQEIDTKAIQDKIRETQAKLTGSTRSKNLKAKYRKNKRDEMAEKRAAAQQTEQVNTIQVTEFISVSELASLLDVSFADVISKCMELGIMVSINQRLDAEVIELVASEFNFNVEFINLEQEVEEDVEEEDDEADMLPRAPIVTIMGHVDHGKTSLLDYIRSSNVVAGEAGGITQHIGAYQVTTSTDKKITFLDTPGHEAFTAMRARGAKVADIAVIVIAADEAIMPQTKEAISHAQAANLPMIFAVNKIDKPGANSEKIKEQLANMNILVEDWGGTYQTQDISAKKGLNIDILLEKIVIQAEMLELKANPDRSAVGSVIEASLDKGRGYLSTILVQNGKLEQGDMIVCGQHFGKIKAMFNERGTRVKKAGPSTPVQVLGLNGAPQAGEKFKVYFDENEAKEIANHRAQIMREQGIRTRKHITLDEIGRRLALGNFKELSVIIKGDFDGSVEALSDSLQKLSTQEVSVNVVHKGVGQITESDVLLATASDAIILGFQVRPSSQAAKLAEQENIELRYYSIIYDAIDEIRSAMEGLLEPKVEKKTVSNIEVREIFKISGVGTIAGCYVLDGKMTRQTKLNIIRDGIVVYTGELASLKRFKDDVKDVNAGYECGLSIRNYNDVRIGDIIEGFEEVEIKRTL